MVRDAMDKSKSAISVKCDENRMFVSADPPYRCNGGRCTTTRFQTIFHH